MNTQHNYPGRKCGDSPVETLGDRYQIPLDQIVTSKLQPRKYFSEEGINQLAASIKSSGIQQDLIVRPIGGDKYELVAGERRYRAAQIVGLHTVPAQVKEMSDTEALHCALTENIQREDLSPIEETEAILRLLELSLDTDKESVISLLNRMANRKRGITDTAVRKPDGDAIASVFTTLGKGSPESFRTHCLPLLKLPPEILDAVHQQKMKPKTAREIAKIQDIELRGKIFQEAIDDSLSFNDVKERINAEKQVSKKNELQTRLDAIPKKTRKTKLWDDQAKLSRLEALLANIEQLLSE